MDVEQKRHEIRIDLRLVENKESLMLAFLSPLYDLIEKKIKAIWTYRQQNGLISSRSYGYDLDLERAEQERITAPLRLVKEMIDDMLFIAKMSESPVKTIEGMKTEDLIQKGQAWVRLTTKLSSLGNSCPVLIDLILVNGTEEKSEWIDYLPKPGEHINLVIE
ncbi:MAG: hypothetical protein J6I84_03205 [Bacilli bacterium]|nr:hypothetical protein [Bacilli bacterium]